MGRSAALILTEMFASRIAPINALALALKESFSELSDALPGNLLHHATPLGSSVGELTTVWGWPFGAC